jgi:hypothetical protein
MTEDRTFAVASDKALVELILRARKRLVVIAPALTQAVADALSRRSDLHATVILDSEAEVYRLGLRRSGGARYHPCRLREQFF